jgi:hypothetical protein
VKLLILTILAIFNLANAIFAADLRYFSITTNEEAEAKQILKSYENVGPA